MKDPQYRKGRRHMALLSIVQIVLFPFAALALLMAVAAISTAGPNISGNRNSFVSLIAILMIYLIPVFIWIWGFFLLSMLRDGFSKSIKKQLLAFYAILLIYCGMWTVSPFERNGESFIFFELSHSLLIILILSIPVITTAFTKSAPNDQIHFPPSP